jgi:hypothetical protein
VLQKYKDDSPLAEWINKQRTYFKHGKMDPERKRRLDEIGFDFKHKDKANEIWNLQVKKLRDFYGKHGHCELFWAVDRLPSS